MSESMLLRKQKQNTIIGIDVNTIIPSSIFEKIIKRIELNKGEKKEIDNNLRVISKTIAYLKKDRNSVYFFESNDLDEDYNKYQKKVLEEIFKKYNINYDKIIICPNELVEAIREFRVDVIFTTDENKICDNENLLPVTEELSERRRKYRLNSKRYINSHTLEGTLDCERSFIDCIPDYTQVVYMGTNDSDLENSNKVQFIFDIYEMAQATQIAKDNINKRKKDIFKSYEYIPKTGNPAFDREDKKYWIASKFENNEYDKVYQKLSRFDFIMFHNRYNMDDPMYYYEPFNVTYTFNDIKEMVLKACNSFKRMGLKKGDCVSICLPNCVQDVVASLALNHMGCIVNEIHPLASLDKIENFIEKTKPKYFIYMDMPTSENENGISLDYLINKYNLEGVIEVSLVEDANSIIKGLFNIKNKLSKDPKRYELKDNDKNIKWKKIMKETSDYDNDDLLDPNDSSYYYSTGGTSAKSAKIVKLPRFFDNISYYNSYGIKMEKGDVAFSNYPGYIAFSDGNCRHQPACVGLLTVLSPKDYPEGFEKSLENTKASVLQVAPQFLRMMLDAENEGKFDNIDLSHFKYVVAGGDKSSNKLKEDTLAFFARHGNTNVHFFVGCGCTELGGSTIVQLFELGNTTDERSIGIPLPIFELKIVDDDKNELENGERRGELLLGIRGIDNIGYVNDEETTNRVFHKESDMMWYDTEDVIEFSKEQSGAIDFISRNKRFIMVTNKNTSGKVVPDDVELQIISNIPEVENCCVVGIDENNETKLKCAVKLKNSDIEFTNELKEKIKNVACKKDVNAQLDEIIVVDSLPLTDRQKVKYMEVEEMFKENNKEKTLSLGLHNC